MSSSDTPTAMLQRIEEDEINLNELFSKIWRRRKFVAGFVFVVMVLVLGVGAANHLLTPTVRGYSESIRFNFPTSIQGAYPSGQRFSKNDLITTAVLKQVYDDNNLSEHDVTFENFASSFTISPYAVNSEFIQRKYDSLLANKKLTRTEIEILEKQYINELSAAQSNFAKLSYVETAHQGLSDILIKKALNDIPKAWSKISIQDLGVLDLKIPGKQFYQPELVEHYEYLQGVQYMVDSAVRFKGMLDTLKKDELGGFVRDPITGMVVVDIQARLKSLKEFELEPMYSIIANLGLVRDSRKAELYLSNQIEIIQDSISERQQKVKVYNNAMRTYNELGSRQGGKSGNSANMAGGTVQYGDEFLSKIVTMVEQQKDTEYRQSLLSEQVKFGLELQQLNTQQIKLKRAAKNLKTDHISEQSLIDSYISNLKTMNNELIELVNAYQRILEVRNFQLLGKNSALYEIASAEITMQSDIKATLKKTLIVAVVSGFLALMLAMFIALIVKEKNLTTDVKG